MPAISVLRRLRQEDHEFEASLGDRVKPNKPAKKELKLMYHLLCVRNYSKCSVCINSFNLYMN
jgi:hypothetical protein